MTGYGQLSDGEINRLVVERLGYEVHWRGNQCILIAPHDTAYSAKDYEFLWGGGIKFASDDEAWGYLRFVHDLNQAVDLLLRQIDGSLSFDESWEVVCPDPDSRSGNRLISAKHTNPARAICEAWLRWKDSAP